MASTSDNVIDFCAICLDSINQEAFLDKCFHTFCYACILKWAKVRMCESEEQTLITCPLCKTESASIIHNFDDDFYEQKHLAKNWFSRAHELRNKWYNHNVQITNSESDIIKFWKRRKYLQRNTWLEKWLRREIQVLILDEDVDIIVHHVLGVIDTFRRQQMEGKKDVVSDTVRDVFRSLLLDTIRPFVVRSERFVTEIEQFLACGLNLEAYDEVCKQCWEEFSAASDSGGSGDTI